MNDESPRQVFQGTLAKDADGGVFVAIPFEVQAVFGTHARLPVQGTINGCSFRGSLFPYGGTHYLGVNRALQETARVQPGETVEIALERDDAPREVNPPEDLAVALAANPAAREAWEMQSYTQRRLAVQAVKEAKRPETRARRIEKIVAGLI